MCTVLVGPFDGHLPPDFFLEGFGLDLGACQQVFGTGSHTEVNVALASGDAAEGHQAVAVPAVDIFFLVGEVPGLDDAVLVAYVLEGGVGVHLRESAVEDGDADTLAVDALGTEILAAHTLQLGVEMGVEGRVGAGLQIRRNIVAFGFPFSAFR